MVEASAPGRPARRDGRGPLVTALMVAACVLLSACSAPGTAPGARAKGGFDLGQLVKTDINRVAETHQQHVFASLRRLADKQLELVSLIYRDTPLALQGDPLRLKQVLTNLVSNAIKFTREGTIAVRAMVEDESDDRAQLRISVQDTGVELAAPAWAVRLAGVDDGYLFLDELTTAPPAVQAAVLVATVVGVAACVLAVRITPETAVVTHADETGAKTPIPRWAYLLGLMAIAFGLGEGTAMDWSGLHVTEVAGIPAAQGSLAVTVVAGFMVAIRLLGDALVARFGRRAVVRFGGACSALGYLITAIATPLPVLLIGWAMVGFGIGMIAPQVYAVAGHAAGGRGLAVVVTFGYATFLCGPAVIGFLAAHFGLQHTMFVPAVLLACLPFLASVMPADERPAPIS